MRLKTIFTNIKIDKKILKRSLLIGVISCLPITGFIYGFVVCTDCGNLFEDFFKRIFLGFIYAFFTVISLGNPWTGSGAVITSTNLRLYVFLILIIIVLLSYCIILKRKKQSAK